MNRRESSNSRVSRRDFLRAGGAGVTATTLGVLTLGADMRRLLFIGIGRQTASWSAVGPRER
ncbi:twin-arginine translocation signal domain-containing protein [Cupriavidus sp. TMH.W2]|uniref:twin-arginine translocation signal domain-containing protein n=1 Tax=Cupriavidus sp. TMH.W2 TaxID=3434465 RepID=UPI003D78690A